MGQSRYERGPPLETAERQHQLVTISCNYCRIWKHYQPADLREVFGETELHAIEHPVRCEACDRRDYMTVEMWAPHGTDLHGLVVRRLVWIETVRRPVWRDERSD